MKAPTPTPHDASRRSIWRVTLKYPEGHRPKKTTKLVRVTSWERDPEASLLGLHARLGTMEVAAVIAGSSTSAPEKPRHLKACLEGRGTKGHRCQCFPRWTEVEELKP